MIDRERERREWQRSVERTIRELEELEESQAAETQSKPLSPLVVDCGPNTTPEDRAAIQAYEDRITALDRRDRW